MVAYDKYYKTDNYFGKAYPGLVKFFREYEPKGKVLDLGCGQGRDTIALATLGYNVTGMDISSVGIAKMLDEAKKQQLKIQGVVSDIYQYDDIDKFDIVLLDSMFHFYKNDLEKESGLLNHLLNKLSFGSVLCNCLMKSKRAELILKDIISKNLHKFEIIKEDYIDYPEANCQYHLYVIKKIK